MNTALIIVISSHENTVYTRADRKVRRQHESLGMETTTKPIKTIAVLSILIAI